MVDTVHQFASVSLGNSAGSSQGHLKIHDDGFSWRSPGAGKSLDIRRSELRGLVWTRIPHKGYQLGIKRQGGPTVQFQGFRDADGETIRGVASGFDQTLQEETLSVSGRNWGKLEVDGSSLLFRVEGDPAFEVPLPEVTSAQQNREEVVFEFAADDTSAGQGREDSLVGMSFHIPASNREFAGEGGEEEDPPAKRFLDRILSHTDAGAPGSSADAVAVFDDVAVMVPRGRFSVEMHLSMVKLVGQTQEYKIKYTSIVRLFVLPKVNSPHSLVVLSLDPPIRKGQTYYTHILCQFQNAEEATVELDMGEEAIAAKNEKLGGKLTPLMSGNIFDVFARCLRGLSGARVTRTGRFANATGGGPAVRCSYKADEGYLYPLEKAFFYIQKPPLLVSHEEIENVEFQRQGTGVVTASAKTFDLVFRLKNQTEHQFRGIQRTEWQNLFDFISEKQLKIENFRTAQQGPGGPVQSLDIGDDIDPGMAHVHAEESDEEEDSDFQMDSGDDDGGEPTTSEDDSDGDTKLVPEDGVESDQGRDSEGDSPGKQADVMQRGDAHPPKKRRLESGAPSIKAKKAKASKSGGAHEEGAGGTGTGKQRKPRAKKDKNAPKRPQSAWIIFMAQNRARAKEEHPEASFGDLGGILSAEWKVLPPEKKAKYEELAAQDKARYVRESEEYKAKLQKAATAKTTDDSDGD